MPKILGEVGLLNAFIGTVFCLASALFVQPCCERFIEALKSNSQDAEDQADFNIPISQNPVFGKLPTPERIDGPKHTEIFSVRGGTKTGAFVLSQSYRWRFGSASEVVDPSGEIAEDFHDYLSDHLAPRLRDIPHIISVGMASCEGEIGNEEARAQERAETLRIWITQSLTSLPSRPAALPSQGFHMVNLGQYRSHSCNDSPETELGTSEQRRIVIMYLDSDFPNELRRYLDDDEALRKAVQELHRRTRLLFDPEGYTLPFRLTGAETIPV